MKRKVLPLINKFSKSGVATEKLKMLAGKKLLKVAPTRWNIFFYVCQRAAKLKKEVTEICLERKWDITFQWSHVELCRDLLRPLATATTYLEGDKYSTSSGLIPALLTISEHLSDPDKKFSSFKNVCKDMKEELGRRFDKYLDPSKEDFDPTFLICTMFNPEKTTELNEQLFEEGKRRVRDLILLQLSQSSSSIAVLQESRAPSTVPPQQQDVVQERARVEYVDLAGPSQPSSSSATKRSNQKDQQRVAAQQALSKRRRLVNSSNQTTSRSNEDILREKVLFMNQDSSLFTM